MYIEQANRLKNIPMSKIREITAKALELQQQGKRIIHFTLGEPDFDTPEYIKEACKKALDEGKTKYATLNGVLQLREAIVEKLEKENNVHYTPDEILVTNGVAQGIFLSLMSFLNNGDEVILPGPGYTSYNMVPVVAGAVMKKYSLREENNFQIDVQELEGLITEKTKILVMINPNNPIGSILTKETLNKVADLVRDKNIIVVVDEIYERLTYDGIRPVCFSSLPGMKDKTIIMNGFSKYFAMTGWRLGYLAGPKPYIEIMTRLSFLATAGNSMFLQYAAAEALRHDHSDCEKMHLEYNRRRDYLFEELNKIDRLSCLKPQGAFYIFLNIKETGMTSDEFAMYLLEEAGVATIPGTAFGDEGEGFVRISYATAYEDIVEAVGKIKVAMNELELNKELAE